MIDRSNIRLLVLLISLLQVPSAIFAETRWPPSIIDLSIDHRTFSLPVSAYRQITAAKFRMLLKEAFQKSGFSFVSVTASKELPSVAKFEFNGDPKANVKPVVLVSFDELANDNGKCDPCFLRHTKIADISDFGTLPWMTQYELAATLVPAIDKAYSLIESSGRQYADPAFGFKYQPQWFGEKNQFGNSFVGIAPTDLVDIIQRLTRAPASRFFIAISIQRARTSS